MTPIEQAVPRTRAAAVVDVGAALLCAALVLLCLALIASTGDLGQFSHAEWRVGRNLALAGCYLAAGIVVRGRSRRLAPLARCLFAVSATMGLFAVSVMLERTTSALGGIEGMGEHVHIGWFRLIMGVSVLGMHGTQAVLPLWFPDGTSPGRAWRLAVLAMAGVYVVYLAPIAWYGPRSANPKWSTWDVAERHDWWRLMTEPVVWMPRLFAVAVLVWLVLRTYRATGLTRRRLTVMLVCYGVYWAIQIGDKVQDIGEDGDPAYWVYLLMLGPASGALAFATLTTVLADDLTGLDRVLRPLLVTVGLTLGLFYCYRGLYAILNTLPGRSEEVNAAFASGVAVLALRPAAGMLLRVVDLLLYGRRAKPYEMLRALSDELSHRVPADDVARSVVDTVVERLCMPAAVLEAHTRHGARELARAGGTGVDEGPWHLVELRHRGEDVGRLTVRLRPGQRSLDANDRAVLDVLGDHLGPLVQAIGLREELRAGRERIVAAREEERRRLRRDLHDGLGPALAGIRLRLETAADVFLADGPREQVGRLIDAAEEDTAHSITEVRRLVDGLRPPDLDERGLPEALRRLALRMPDSVRVETRLPDPGELPELAAACEVAAYRIAAEALINVAKHAGASAVVLSLRVDDESLVLEITDNGTGPGPVERPGGVGLGSMTERAEETGGNLRIGPRPDGVPGTRVLALLPTQLM
ncbi:sensor histidine kinase [Streptomyces caeruleatus]|uniref:sensor histidine kinase n=1 Tax=Streptomyces caeruleatus TaxID=661399 RepID=UPI00131CA607|nr:sensor histidine kinase [Streptomyces caeruleatus]